MKLAKIFLTLISLFALAAPFSARADNAAYSGAGGTFTTGTAAGQAISVQGSPLAGTNATVSFSCPITFFGAGTYQWNWSCAGGSMTIAASDKSVALTGSFSSGTMTYSGSGGGRGGHTTYWYLFSGSYTGTMTLAGHSQRVYGSISTVLKTSTQVGSSGAPLTSLSLGWDSAYSPVVVGDAVNGRLLGADNVTGANLVKYGSWGSGTGHFEAIAGLAHDASGRIYVTDSSLNRLVRIDDLTGKDWTQLGSYGVGSLHFKQPLGVAVDSAGKIWVADAGNHRIVRFDDMTGKNWTAFGTLGTGAKEFSAPAAIAFDALGRIYVADSGNNRLVRFDDLTGKNWTTLSMINISVYGYLLTGVNSVAVVPSGKIYVATPSGGLYRVDDMT